MKLERIKMDKKMILGIAYRGENYLSATDHLWEEFFERIDQVPGVTESSDFYALSEPVKGGMLHYLVGVEVKEVKEIPKGMQVWHIRHEDYVVYAHKGGKKGIPRAFRHIYSELLPEAGLVPSEDYDFEVYTSDYYDKKREDSIVYLCVPILSEEEKELSTDYSKLKEELVPEGVQTPEGAFDEGTFPVEAPILTASAVSSAPPAAPASLEEDERFPVEVPPEDLAEGILSEEEMQGLSVGDVSAGEEALSEEERFPVEMPARDLGQEAAPEVEELPLDEQERFPIESPPQDLEVEETVTDGQDAPVEEELSLHDEERFPVEAPPEDLAEEVLSPEEMGALGVGDLSAGEEALQEEEAFPVEVPPRDLVHGENVPEDDEVEHITLGEDDLLEPEKPEEVVEEPVEPIEEELSLHDEERFPVEAPPEDLAEEVLSPEEMGALGVGDLSAGEEALQEEEAFPVEVPPRDLVHGENVPEDDEVVHITLGEEDLLEPEKPEEVVEEPAKPLEEELSLHDEERFPVEAPPEDLAEEVLSPEEMGALGVGDLSAGEEAHQEDEAFPVEVPPRDLVHGENVPDEDSYPAETPPEDLAEDVVATEEIGALGDGSLDAAQDEVIIERITLDEEDLLSPEEFSAPSEAVEESTVVNDPLLGEEEMTLADEERFPIEAPPEDLAEDVLAPEEMGGLGVGDLSAGEDALLEEDAFPVEVPPRDLVHGENVPPAEEEETPPPVEAPEQELLEEVQEIEIPETEPSIAQEEEIFSNAQDAWAEEGEPLEPSSFVNGAEVPDEEETLPEDFEDVPKTILPEEPGSSESFVAEEVQEGEDFELIESMEDVEAQEDVPEEIVEGEDFELIREEEMDPLDEDLFFREIDVTIETEEE